MKPILFDPSRPIERINCTADCPAAIVSEICGQLAAGVTDIDELCHQLNTWAEFEDTRWVVKSVLDMLVALGFLELDSKNPGSGYRVIRPMSIAEDFSEYLEQKRKEDESFALIEKWQLAGEPWVSATIQLDDAGYFDSYPSEATFNAAPYLLSEAVTAKDLDLLAEMYADGQGAGGLNFVGWDYPADDVAHGAAEYDSSVRAVFGAQQDNQGFECYIDWEELVSFLKSHRLDLIKESNYFRFHYD